MAGGNERTDVGTRGTTVILREDFLGRVMLGMSMKGKDTLFSWRGLFMVEHVLRHGARTEHTWHADLQGV